jgi:hypothetical protein
MDNGRTTVTSYFTPELTIVLALLQWKSCFVMKKTLSTVFWDSTSCSLIHVYWCSSESSANFYLVTAVRTLNWYCMFHPAVPQTKGNLGNAARSNGLTKSAVHQERLRFYLRTQRQIQVNPVTCPSSLQIARNLHLKHLWQCNILWKGILTRKVLDPSLVWQYWFPLYIENEN